MNYAITDIEFKLIQNMSYDDFNEYLFNKILETSNRYRGGFNL